MPAQFDRSMISYPTVLKAGQSGRLTFRAVNTGSTTLYLIVEMVDTATNQVIGTAYGSPHYTTPYGPLWDSYVDFTMPSRNLNFQLKLRD